MKYHASITQSLYNMVQNQSLPHAIILSGDAGNPSLPIALDLITYLHCTQKKEFDHCKQCSSCIKISKLIHPDFHCVVPLSNAKNKAKYSDYTNDWKSFIIKNNYPILQDWAQYLGNEAANINIAKEQIQYLRANIAQKAFESTYKTILVWLPETLNAIAANAMLKMVEEPRPKTYFIFITNRLHHVLPTMRSRMWNIAIPKISNESTLALLSKKHPNIPKNHITSITHIVQGNINLAEKLLQDEQVTYFDDFAAWMRKTYVKELTALINIADNFHNYTLQLQKNWLIYALHLLRNVLLIQAGLSSRTLLNPHESSFCKKFSQTVSLHQLSDIINHISHLYNLIHRNANAKLSFINASLKISALF